MKRLLELPPDDRLTARAQELVRAVGPTPESEERLRRVRRALDERAAPRRGALPVAALAILLAAGAAAAAGSGVLSRFSSPEPAQSAAPAMVRVEHSSAAPRRELEARPPVTAHAPDEAAAPGVPAPHLSVNRAPVPSPSSDVARVHEAAKALRRDHDPERALALLEQSGASSGPLAEEALALRIEAALSRGDRRAGELAKSYLARYPNGRYQGLAKKALGGSAP